MSFWQGRRVLITGHTRFKGAWLSLWLLNAGARVTCLALPPDTSPSLLINWALRASWTFARRHLSSGSAAARLARLSCASGHMASRALDKPCAAVLVTTDKVYQNQEWEFGYRESNPVGGHDPHSASKAATEVAISCSRHCYHSGASPVLIASASAGNVIGGGNWSEKRIVPDMVRALSAGRIVKVRNPKPCGRGSTYWSCSAGGYLVLAQKLLETDERRYQDAFNFGRTI